MRRKWIYVVLAGVAGVLFVWGSSASARGPSGKALQKIIEAQERHTERLLAMEGVVGTAAGSDAVVVLVKIPEAAEKIPKDLDGVPVVVKVSGEIRALGATGRFGRPVPIGVSTGNEGECSAGTIGARVTDDTNVYALSNNHVYALENSAPIGSKILQPGLYDTDCNFGENNVIGTLFDFGPIEFSPTANNTIDAAIALSAVEKLDTATPSDGYGTPQAITVAATLGEQVQKYGRTTSLTKGEITGINATVLVGYGSGTARFVDQIIVESRKPFIKAGDSGSLLVTDPDRNPVGLLFAGNRSGKLAVANRIDLVLSEFNVSVDASAPPPDTRPPTLTDVTPADAAVDVPVNTNVVVTFSEPVNGVDNTTFKLSAGGVDILRTLTVANDRLSAALDPNADLAPETLHTVTVTTGISDDAGNAMAVDFTSSFTTAAAPTAGVTVTSIDPNTMQAGSTIDVTITGSGFAAGASVTFEDGSGPAPQASKVVFADASSITATVTAKSGGPPRNRVWDVRVTNPDGSSGLLVDGLTVTP